MGIKAKKKTCSRGHIYTGSGPCPICWPGAKKRAQRLAARQAADAAQAVLSLFEKERPKDKRPRAAIAAIRAWASGKLHLGMKEIRKFSLDAHAAARAAKSPPAVAAARAAGHAVATAHVITHAKGATIYAKLARARLAHPEKRHKLTDFL